MTHKRMKLMLGGLVVASAIGYLAYAGAQRGWVYTMGVDDYLKKSATEQLQRVRLCGSVGEEDLEVSKAQLVARFQLKGEHGSIPVAYTGTIPDMFKAGAEVVVEGQRDGSGVFQSDVLMTKCASKYENKMPEGHPAVKQQGGQP